jgi:nucleoside-diphosphate-sugar epimerase
MNEPRFVVTGATGHLGRYVVHALAGRGQVVALSRSGALPAAPFGEAAAPCGRIVAKALDLTSERAALDLARELGPEAVLIHLAAWHPPATANTGPRERCRLLEHNVLGTMRALDAARRERGGVAAVVYASSFEVYGIPEAPGAVTEEHRVNPISDYGASKLAGEDHLMAFAYEEQTRVVALRFPAIYGAGEHTSRALPNFLKQVARGERPRIMGSGTDLRDQVHALDAARAIELCALGGARGIFNLADGEPHSIASLARAALAVAGLADEPDFAPSERARYDFHMSVDKAQRELGFVPEVTLGDGLRQQLAWLRAGAP